jgi:hypothetical protein
MLVADILHEWDIGGGKTVIAHLFRILEVIKRQDNRYSSILVRVDERWFTSFPAYLSFFP